MILKRQDEELKPILKIVFCTYIDMYVEIKIDLFNIKNNKF